MEYELRFDVNGVMRLILFSPLATTIKLNFDVTLYSSLCTLEEKTELVNSDKFSFVNKVEICKSTVSPGIEPGYIVFPSHKNNV